MSGKGNKVGFDVEIAKKAIRVAANTEGLVNAILFDAIVQSGSQDEDALTCVVDSVDSNINNLTVRYHLCVEDGEIRVPADDSTVTVAMTSFTNPYIVKDTELISYQINTGDCIVSLKNGEAKITQGKCVITLSGGKISIKNDGQDFKTLMDDFFTHIKAMTFTNGAGTTGIPNNVSDISDDQTKFDGLWQ